MKHTTRYSWKIILVSLSAFALYGCASNAPQMSLLSDQDLCYQYLYIPTNDGRYDNYVYGEVEYRTYYKGLLWCDTFARGQANNIREASVQRFANRVNMGDVLGQLADAYGSGQPTTGPAQPPAPVKVQPIFKGPQPQPILIINNPQNPTVECFDALGDRKVVKFVLRNCPFGYTEVR